MENIMVYEAYIQNFPIALEVISKCSKENVQFRDLTASIKVKSLGGQSLSLQEMLHKPVSRIQSHAMVLQVPLPSTKSVQQIFVTFKKPIWLNITLNIFQDLLNNTPAAHPDHLILSACLQKTQSFLAEVVVVQSGDHSPHVSNQLDVLSCLVLKISLNPFCPTNRLNYLGSLIADDYTVVMNGLSNFNLCVHSQRDRNVERVLVKNAFIVEVLDDNQSRKLRHLFLFSDAIVCAKYKVIEISINSFILEAW